MCFSILRFELSLLPRQFNSFSVEARLLSLVAEEKDRQPPLNLGFTMCSEMHHFTVILTGQEHTLP